MKKTIVHFLHADKFTNGYIKFMQQKENEYEHYFICTKNEKYKMCEPNIIWLDNGKDFFSSKVKKILKDANKIIVSGVFGIQKNLILYPHNILKKTYLQFWGADFYSYRSTNLFSKRIIYKIFMQICISKCAGIINLIDEDYEELKKVFPNKKPHYVCCVPGAPDTEKKFDYNKYIMREKNNKNIIIGNSATPENHQIEILECLEHLKNKDIHIFCPLSYGNKEYASEVVKKGEEIFGNKFTGMTEFMKYEEYVEFLSSCDVGIFNNDRQQAMGNIGKLLKMGKKIYLREGTSMFKNYSKHDITIYSTKELNSISYSDLFAFDRKIGINNYNNMIKREKELEEAWNKLLNL